MQHPLGFALVVWTVTPLGLADIFGVDVMLDVAAVASGAGLAAVVVLLAACGVITKVRGQS